MQFTPFLGILAGIVLTLLIIVLVIILVIRLKYKHGEIDSDDKNSENDPEENYRSFQFENNSNMISGRIAPGTLGNFSDSEKQSAKHHHCADTIVGYE